MKQAKPSSAEHLRIPRYPFAFITGLLLTLSSAIAGADQIYQIPLAVGTDVPGNLLLVPSVEFPTVDSVANIDDTYDEDTEYVGYFDPDKCYKYAYEGDDSDKNHFYPSSITDDHSCTGDDEWSGNYLDWAATQTIDPFRKALTGGYRFKDDDETWLQKARSDSNASTTYFPDRALNENVDSGVIARATPFSDTRTFSTIIRQLGNEMSFEVLDGYSYQGGESSTSSVFTDSGEGSWTSSSSSSSVVKKTNDSDYIHSSDYSLKVSSSGGNSTKKAYQNLDESVSDLNFTFSGWVYSASSATEMTLSVEGKSGGYGVKFSSNGIYIVKMSNGQASTKGNSISWSYLEAQWVQFKLEATTTGITLTVYKSDGTEIGSVTTKDSSYSSFTKVVIYSGKYEYYVDDLTVSATTQTLPFEKNGTNKFLVNIRVKVCDPDVGLEENCVQYGDHYKPEGLLQEYANEIRVGVFSYLNISNTSKNGGVLRSRLHFIGDTMINTDGSEEENENMEWDPDTGILVQNPDPDDASDTDTGSVPIEYSGVINYINDFGELTTETHKSYDPVSELYYAAIRYYRGLEDVADFSDFTATDDDDKYLQADGFPVITDWQASDPETGSIQYYCQKSAILGIGDVYTHNDGNLPGGSSPPSEISGDTPPNVKTATNKVLSLQGVSYSGNSTAYIAGLAYYWHTNDMRDDFDDDQTVTTYWVDVQEGQVTRNPSNNQYYLATKFGGFDVPEGFKPMADTTTSLEDEWWESGDSFTAEDDEDYQRPSNYFLAGDAAKMVSSLEEAFEDISSSTTGSASSVAANSTSLDQDTVIYQARYSSDHWTGDLRAYLVEPSSGEKADDYKWSAEEEMPDPADRNIYVHNPDASGADSKFISFEWGNLSSAQQEALGSEEMVDYLRGEEISSITVGDTKTYLRERDGILGDIVHSTPVYVAPATESLYASSTFKGGGDEWISYVEETEAEDYINAIYVSSNDGMLHAFRTDGSLAGQELFAFIPNAAILARGGLDNSMAALADSDYSHVYYVDGELVVGDAYVDGEWKTVLVGTLGRGGPGVFALDVTNPNSPKFLWEMDGDDIPALGRDLGQPVIAQIANGNWQVILGNGVDSTDGHAELVMIPLDDPDDVTVTDTTDATETDTLNGLTAVFTVDTDSDGFVDTLYAGDLEGHLWKFTDLTASEATHQILFEATDPDGTAQPITAAPLVAEESSTDTFWVFFGTGRYLSKDDISDTQVQTWYGIKDEGKTELQRSNLAEREIIYEVEGTEDTDDSEDGTTVDETEEWDGQKRVITPLDEAEDDIDDFDGWRIDLVSPLNGQEGERMVIPNYAKGEALVGVTRIPDTGDACAVGGRAWVMSIDPFTGAALESSFFDINGDDTVDSSDTITINGKTYVVSGVGFDTGVNGVTFIGSALEASLDTASVTAIMTSSSSSSAERTSWHEVLDQ